MKPINGIIVVNGYYKSESYTDQTEKIRKELGVYGINADIWENNKAITIGQKFDIDFAVFLDKDINLANILKNSGILVINNPKAIALADNKIKTAIELDKYGFELPKTIPSPLRYHYCGADREFLKQTAEILGYPVVVKNAYGSLGMQVFLAKTYDELVAIDEKIGTDEHFYQEYVKNSTGKSIRIITVGKKYVCAMRLSNDNDFRSNAELGGKAEKFIPDKKLMENAEKIAQIMDLDFCGIDFFDNTFMLIEVNSNAFFKRAESVCNVNVAGKVAEYIANKLKNGENLKLWKASQKQ